VPSQIDRSLDGSVALVTGASSGIGEATARLLAAHGASVAVAARRLDRLEQLTSEIRDLGTSAVAMEADLAEPDQATTVIERTIEALGRIDILVNNAGVMLLGPIEEAPIDEWTRMIELNLRGLIHTTHAALPHLIAAAESGERGCSDVINISSVSGRIARVGSGVYSSTKFGVGAFSESFRQEFADRRVRSILIEPGTVDTELISHVRDGIREQALETVVGVRCLDASDIADAIAYAVTRPWHVSVNEILVRPTQERG
jgi:NADP-dependent 3-hydroxy acid dehydrogenase YdfG